tara:strand:+ start:838 stop:2055 length:1218 start_codon:yes stop_codon:yes gene_type:complete
VKITTKIAFRQLLPNHNFSFISFTTILTIIGLSIGVASLITISCISKGFSIAVNTKLSNIDGHIRITTYDSSPMPMIEIANLDSNIFKTFNNVEESTAYIEKHILIKNMDNIEGVILYGVSSSSLKSIFNLDKISLNDSLFNENNSIILGKTLAENLNVNVNDDIITFDIEGMSREKFIKAEKFIVSNIFETNFPEYDRLLAFTSLDFAQNFFNMNNEASGLIINAVDAYDAKIIEDNISKTIIQYPYISHSWQDRHHNLLAWLTVYDAPIKIIIIFIAIIGLFNLSASLWMIVIEKKKEFAILQSMGLHRLEIKKIILKEGASIGIMGAIGGVVISFVLLLFQKNFHIVSLPEDIYFMNYLPVCLDGVYFIIYPLLTLIVAIIFSYIPAKQSIDNDPSRVLACE